MNFMPDSAGESQKRHRSKFRPHSLMAFADTSVLSKIYAARTGTRVDSNQEMVVLAANLAAGLFQGFPVSSSSSRTPVADAAGSRSLSEKSLRG